MMNVNDWIARLKHLCENRVTHYNNTFPANCGYINSDGSISFDCIGLVKTVINEPGIVYKTEPAGFYVAPGKVIPDTNEIGILYLCSGVAWNNFQGIAPGEYLYMGGHAGVYAGDAFGKNAAVNVIECTVCWGVEGVVASWLDINTGARCDRKGGTQVGTWEAHGKLDKYISYKDGLQKGPDGNWYYYKNGEIDRSFNGLAQNAAGWWKCTKGMADFSFNGLVQNSLGWWMCESGKVNFGYNGLAKNEIGWWMVQDGQVDFSFNGLVPNAAGIWVTKKGQVDEKYSGTYRFSGKDYKIKNGKVV